MHDLVIRHGTVIDGSGAPRRPADVAVHAGRIADIGTAVGRGREEIDASGMIVAPGFIDTHTHDDQALLVQPEMRFKISQGVTTCVCGNCGVSLAPLPGGELPEPLTLLAEGHRFARPAGFLQALRDTPSAVNSVPLLGHSSLRATVMDRTDRAARDDEVAAMRALAREALQAGYHGISTGLFYGSAKQATTQEVIDVCAPLTELGGIYTTHMRDENDHVLASIEETATIGRALGVTTLISHHKVSGLPNHGRSVQTLARIAELQRELPLALDAYPYAAGSTVLTADRVAWSARTLVTFSRPHPEAAGRDLAELAQERGLSIEALCAELHPAGAIYFAMDEADVQRILAYPETMIGSDGIPLQTRPHPRLWGTFPRVLGHYCRERGLFTLETAVHKMTGLPASRFGLADRGLLSAGRAADVTIFDAERVIDRASFEDPEQTAAGIETVIVNGQVAWRDRQVVARPGRLLPRGALSAKA